MSYNYTEYTNRLRTETGIDDIFPYSETPYELLCDKLFQQFQFHLEKNFDNFNIRPAIFFFNNIRRVNAWADLINGTYVNSCNIGTVDALRKVFLEIDLDELIKRVPELEYFRVLEAPLRTALNDQLFVTAFLYIFYHESAHLLQKSANGNPGRTTECGVGKPFNIQDHVYELDADLFAAIRLVEHIEYNWTNKFGEELRTQEVLEKLIVVSAMGPAVFKLLFIEFSQEIYYEQKTHPHSFIRTIAILHNLVNYSQTLIGSKHDIQLDYAQLTQRVILLFDKVLPALLGDRALKNLKAIYRNEGTNISQYYDKLAQMVEDDPTTAISQMHNKSFNST